MPSSRRALKRTVAIAAVSPLVLALGACGSSSSGDDGGVTIVAGAYPFAYVAEQIGGTMVNVENLTSPGVEPHDVELTAKQLGSITDADLVVFLHGFQPPVDEAIDEAGLGDDVALDVADTVELLPADEDDHSHADDDHADDDHAEEDHADDGTEEDDHGHGGVDPHVWLDPANMVTIADAVAERLVELDPDNADTYQANAAELDAELQQLDNDFESGLATCEIRTFVTSHAAFGYLAHAYDLTQIAIAGIEPNTEPTTKQLAEIIELVQTEDITTVFTEELTSPQTAETVAREAGVETAVLSPIEGLTDETEDETYVTLMRENLAALAKANRCA